MWWVSQGGVLKVCNRDSIKGDSYVLRINKPPGVVEVFLLDAGKRFVMDSIQVSLAMSFIDSIFIR